MFSVRSPVPLLTSNKVELTDDLDHWCVLETGHQERKREV